MDKSTRNIITGEDFRSLAEYHEFVRDDEVDEANKEDWKTRISRRYYDKLYKEYAIIDLSRYESGEIGMRWRTEAEVVNGKGHLICGARKCDSRGNLKSFEVPFKYEERGSSKLELVKIRLCPICAEKLAVSLRVKEESTQESSKKREAKLIENNRQKTKKQKRSDDL
jgi:protein FRA10AC1